jgi:hypothetical protein
MTFDSETPTVRKGYVFKKTEKSTWVGVVFAPGYQVYYGTWREVYDTVDNAMRSSDE